MELRIVENWSFVGYAYNKFKKENNVPENREVLFSLNGKQYLILPKGQRTNATFSVEAQFKDGENFTDTVLARSHSLAIEKFKNKHSGSEYSTYDITSVTKL